MKVQKIYVKNLRQIDEQIADFNGCTAIITGGNNKGKTTLLRSIIERLRGDKTNIVKNGSMTGECERTFTDGSRLVWELSEKKEKLDYYTKDGLKESRIKSICDLLFGQGFDIDKFLSATPKQQKETLQKIVGIDFTEIDNQYVSAYEERTKKNAIMKSEQAKTSDLVIVDKTGEKKDISEMQNVLIEVEKKNEQINSVESKLIDKEKRKTQILEELKRLQEEQKSIEEDIKKGEKRLEENKKQDTQDIRHKIEEQKIVNETHEKNEYVVVMQKSFENAKKEREIADKKVKKIESKKLEMIKSANMPEGFEFGEDCIMFNGYIMDRSNLSSSQTYIAGLMLASMVMGKVEVLIFDASYLDKSSLLQIQKWADDKGLQLLIERPDFDGGEIKYEIIQSDA